MDTSVFYTLILSAENKAITELLIEKGILTRTEIEQRTAKNLRAFKDFATGYYKDVRSK